MEKNVIISKSTRFHYPLAAPQQPIIANNIQTEYTIAQI